jgi:prepilin-type processing-associated H-X9-DG protein
MHPSGAVGIFSTPVQFADGHVEEFPDSELRVCGSDGNVPVRGMRFASSRPIPDRMQVRLQNNGDGTVTVTGQVPGAPTVTLYNLPIQDGEVVLPDEAFFPIPR